MPTLKVKRLHPNAKLPSFAHPEEDAAFDIFVPFNTIISPHAIYALDLGIACEIDPAYFIKLEGKSGLAKRGLCILGGVIDAGYRGPWHVQCINLGYHAIHLNAGDAIVQGVIHLKPSGHIMEVTELSESARGEHGFGSGHTTNALQGQSEA